MDRSVSVIVPVYNTPDLVTLFWNSFLYKSGLEFVFVDNASDKATAQALHDLRVQNPGICIVRNAENLGFGVANNQGAEAAQGSILVFTQLDVVVRGEIFKLCQRVSDEYLYGARLLGGDTGWNNFDGRVIPYLEGFFLVASRTAWNTIGGFDPIYYPADFEDIDLSHTAAQKGLKLALLTGLRVEHNHPGRAGWDRYKAEQRQAVTLRNRAKFREKWRL